MPLSERIPSFKVPYGCGRSGGSGCDAGGALRPIPFVPSFANSLIEKLRGGECDNQPGEDLLAIRVDLYVPQNRIPHFLPCMFLVGLEVIAEEEDSFVVESESSFPGLGPEIVFGHRTKDKFVGRSREPSGNPVARSADVFPD